MRIEIYGEKQNDPEKVLRLRLFRQGAYVVLSAVDKEGDRVHCGNLITFFPDGKVRRNSAVNKEIGLRLDEEERLVFDE